MPVADSLLLEAVPLAILPNGGARPAPPAFSRLKKHRISVVAIITLFAIIGALLWHQWIKPEFLPRNFGVVQDGAIYRSAQHSPRVLRQLCTEYHIKTILDLGGAAGFDSKTQAQRDVAAELGIERVEFLLPSDGTGDPEKYVRALQLMRDPQRQPVLVHCGAGAQRTSTAVILYRTVIQGMSVTEAYPESFSYKHKPDEWELLAYIADNLPKIRELYWESVTTVPPPTAADRDLNDAAGHWAWPTTSSPW